MSTLVREIFRGAKVMGSFLRWAPDPAHAACELDVSLRRVFWSIDMLSPKNLVLFRHFSCLPGARQAPLPRRGLSICSKSAPWWNFMH